MTWQMVYWITRLDAIRNVSIGVAISLAITVIVLFIVGFSYCGDNTSTQEDKKIQRQYRRVAARCVCPLVFLLFLITFIPSTKEACAIYLIPKIVNNEQVQKVPENALKLLNAKFEEWIDEQIGDTDATQD